MGLQGPRGARGGPTWPQWVKVPKGARGRPTGSQGVKGYAKKGPRGSRGGPTGSKVGLVQACRVPGGQGVDRFSASLSRASGSGKLTSRGEDQKGHKGSRGGATGSPGVKGSMGMPSGYQGVKA